MFANDSKDIQIRKMPLLSHRNHFQFGYNGIPFVFRQKPEDQWFVAYGPCEREPFNFHDECLQTARTIREQTKDPIVVMFSGGSDSEVALRSFVEAQIPVSAAILRFANDLNVHDISWAVVICESLGVPYRFYDLNIHDFWQQRLWEYADPTHCISPQLLSTMWLIDQIEGYPVMGSGECLLVKQVPPDYEPGVSPYEASKWDLWEKEIIASWYRHFMIRSRDGCPGFFQYTAEIMLSYLQDPFVVQLVNNQIIGKLSTASSKLAIYQQHFPLITRPKYTGFEKLQAEDSVLRKQLYAKFSHSHQKALTPYHDLVQMLKPRA